MAMLTSFNTSRGLMLPKKLINRMGIEGGDLYEISTGSGGEIIFTPYNKEKRRKEWIEDRWQDFIHNDGHYEQRDNIIFVHLSDGYSDRYGTAKPYYLDKFDLDVGIAVATATALGLEIPEYI